MNSHEDNPMNWSDENISDSTTNATRGKVTLVAIVILFVIFVVMTFLHLYDRWRLRNYHIRRSRMVFFATNPSHTASCGLDPAVVNSLPVFTFSWDATHKDLTDCAVCLSEFEEGESGRVLPGCKHSFHVDCIDMWFHSHSTCPLCRILVEPPSTTVEEQVKITISPEPVSATEPDRISGSSAMPLADLGRISAGRNFTRMLSRDRRSSPSSFVGAQSQ